MEREDIEKAAKSYQEKDHDIWTGKGMAYQLVCKGNCGRF